MKRVVGLFTVALLTFVLMGPVLAQPQFPKSSEGAGAKRQESKSTEDPDVRKAKKKKKTPPAETQNLKGTEDPDVRKEPKNQ